MKTFANYKCQEYPTDPPDYLTGQYPSNKNGYPEIWGHYAKNEEFLANYGDSGRTSPPIDRWKDPSGIIMIGECKDPKEVISANVRSDKTNCTAPYIEPGGTTWLEVFDELSYRHNNGQNSVYLDGHARFRTAAWFQTLEGKHAICPPKETLNNTAGW